MARDYSSRRNKSRNQSKTKSRQTPRAKPAARRTRKQAARGGPPGWVWFVCGLCLAAAGAAGLYIFARPAGSRDNTQQISVNMPSDTPGKPAGNASAGASGKTPPADTDAPASGSQPQSPQKPSFSFYKILPKYQVVVPQENNPDHAPQSSGTTTANHGTASHAGNAQVDHAPAGTPQPTAPTDSASGSYVIQAGSFSTYADADRRKAELALLGVTPQIVDINLSSGKTVYRVQSHTIHSSDRLNALLKRLRNNHIDTLVIHPKD